MHAESVITTSGRPRTCARCVCTNRSTAVISLAVDDSGAPVLGQASDQNPGSPALPGSVYAAPMPSSPASVATTKASRVTASRVNSSDVGITVSRPVAQRARRCFHHATSRRNRCSPPAMGRPANTSQSDCMCVRPLWDSDASHCRRPSRDRQLDSTTPSARRSRWSRHHCSSSSAWAARSESARRVHV